MCQTGDLIIYGRPALFTTPNEAIDEEHNSFSPIRAREDKEVQMKTVADQPPI